MQYTSVLCKSKKTIHEHQTESTVLRSCIIIKGKAWTNAPGQRPPDLRPIIGSDQQLVWAPDRCPIEQNNDPRTNALCFMYGTLLRVYTNVTIIFLLWYFFPMVLKLANTKMYVRDGKDGDWETVNVLARHNALKRWIATEIRWYRNVVGLKIL